jgi:hypothetical protein
MSRLHMSGFALLLLLNIGSFFPSLTSYRVLQESSEIQTKWNSFPVRCVKAKLKLSHCLTNWALRHEGICGSGCIYSRFIYLGTSWMWVDSFTPLPLYPRRKSPLHVLGRRLGGPENRCGTYREVKILDSTRIGTPTAQSFRPQPLAIRPSLPRLSKINRFETAVARSVIFECNFSIDV